MARQSSVCTAVQPHLEAFADGELRGNVLRRVSDHIESCGNCGALVDSVKQVGHVMRSGQPHTMDVAVLAGLADGVVSRVRAEERESWRGVLDRATDDLHSVLVGAGSIAAAFVTAMSVSIVMHSSVEQRADSLAAVLSSMSAPPQLGRSTIVPDSVAPDSIVGANGEDDVEFANLTEVNRAGHVTSLQPLALGDQINPSDSQSLTNQLRSLRFAQTERANLTDPDARRFIWLYTATEVRGANPDARRFIWLYTTPNVRGKKSL